MINRMKRVLASNSIRTYRAVTAPTRALPSFIVVGVDICGTTSFYQNLCKHPQIVPSSVKEVHYFDRHYDKSMNWYKTHFPRASALKPGQITGEATPDYICDPEAAERLHASGIDFKGIVMLRDPVKRAYALYQKHIRLRNKHVLDGEGVIPFAPLIRRELEYLRQHTVDEALYRACFKDIRARHAANKQGTTAQVSYTFPPYLLRGLYHLQLGMWLRLFPREKLLILRSEDYFADSLGVVSQVASEYLGLPLWTPAEYVKARNEGNRYPPMDSDIEAELRAFFRPHNEALAAIMNRDLRWA